MKIAELDTIIKELFEDSLISSVKTVYELSDDKKFYKLIISYHFLKYQENTVLHTKLLFNTDLDKINIINDKFGYLYDINCSYKYKTFTDGKDLSTKIDSIFGGNDFGTDLLALSEFSSQSATSINYQLSKLKIDDISVYEVKYNPKFKIMACEDTEFNFDINISNNYNVSLNLIKKAKNKYLYTLLLADATKEIETQGLSDIPVVIAKGLVEIFNNLTESKQTDF